MDVVGETCLQKHTWRDVAETNAHGILQQQPLVEHFLVPEYTLVCSGKSKPLRQRTRWAPQEDSRDCRRLSVSRAAK